MQREFETDVTTVTFLCTDIVGSTRLWQEDGALMRERLAWHDAQVHELASQFSGDVFKARGDGFFVAFSTALTARDMAVALQQALFQEFGEAFAIRTVLSTGEAEHRDGDYFGLALSRAARVLELSHGTQLVLTETSARLILEAEPTATAQLQDLGTFQIRSLEQAERLFQLLIPGLPTEFPPLSSASLPPHNLPRTLTSFIGREKECAEVERLLSQTRLLSILGAGGSGKTRLSLHVGDTLLTQYPGGVWFVDLAPVADGALLPRAVAAALRVREDAGAELMPMLLRHLATRKLLLILDNCEHLVAAAAQLTEQVLAHCPDVTVLATSREALELFGEVAWPLPGLTLPPETVTPPARLLRYEAISLFVERATATSPSFRLTTTNGSAVARVCRRLDGIPLALELAAAWTSALSLEQIEKRLADRFGFLIRGSRTALPRQQTLRGTLDWSHNLLMEEERILWRRLSVFAGGFTLESAEAICTDDPLPDYGVLDSLVGLLRKSLILRDGDSDERYRILETVREYGLEKLKEADELSPFRLRHLEHFTALAEEAEPHLRGPDQKPWMDRLETEHSNLRAALTKPENGEFALRLASAIFWFWRVRQHFAEGLHFLNNLIPTDTNYSQLLHAKALRALGILSMEIGTLNEAKRALRQSQQIYENLENTQDAIIIISNLGILAIKQGNLTEAKENLYKAIDFYQKQNDKARVAMLLTNLGCAIISEDNPNSYQEAKLIFLKSYEINAKINDREGEASALFNIAYASFKLNDLTLSKTSLIRFLKLSNTNDISSGQTKGLLLSVKILKIDNSNSPIIVPLLGKIHCLLTEGNTPLDETEVIEYNFLTSTLSNSLGVEEYQKQFNSGIQLSMDEVLELIESES